MGYELFRLLAGTKAQQRKKKISKARKKPVCVDIEEEDREKDIMLGKDATIDARGRENEKLFRFPIVMDIAEKCRNIYIILKADHLM